MPDILFWPQNVMNIYSSLPRLFQVCLIGDSVGSIMTYDALCKHNPHLHGNSRYGSNEGLHEEDIEEHQPVRRERSNLETIKQVSVSNPDLNNLGNGTGPNSSQSKSEQPNEHRQVTHTQSAQRAHSVRITHSQRHASCPNSRRTSTGSNTEGRFDFEVTDFFMFGAPLAVILAYRKLIGAQDQNCEFAIIIHAIIVMIKKLFINSLYIWYQWLSTSAR